MAVKREIARSSQFTLWKLWS